jgi:putative membrane protein
MDASGRQSRPPQERPRPASIRDNPNLLRDRLANERTFLAWLRTGIAVTSLGFVVARFDLFLEELARAAGGSAAAAEAASGSAVAVPIGVLLVLAGPVVVALAAARYLQTERALLHGRPESRRLIDGIVLAVTAGAVVAGVALALHILDRV